MKKLLPGLLILVLGLLVYGAATAQPAEPELPPTIVAFNAETALTLPEVEAAASEMTLNWTVVGLRDGDSLVLEAITQGEWLPLSGEPLNASASRTFTVAHGSEFSPPTYRLVIRDASAQMVDVWVLSVPYVPTDEPPAITTFESDVESISRADLRAGTVEIAVRWEVANRIPTSNLVFEQVLPDESTVSVEKPRTIRWISSTGEGAVVPVDAESITLRLSLLDLVSGDPLDSAEITLDVEEVAAAPSSAPPAGNSGLPTINAFTVSQFNADYGDTVEVTWDVDNAADITVTVMPRDRATVELGQGLPNTGSLAYTLPEDGRFYRVDFTLTASNSSSQSEERIFNLVMNCEVPWFFNEQHGASNCAAQSGAEVNAAHQQFEGGIMLWRVDTSEIYVLGRDGRFEIFQDTWSQGEDFTSAETPPEGLLAPARGFGKVWAQNQRVRDELGWATGPETGYRMLVQNEVPVYKAYQRYMTIPGDHVIRLHMGTALVPMGTWGTVGR